MTQASHALSAARRAQTRTDDNARQIAALTSTIAALEKRITALETTNEGEHHASMENPAQAPARAIQ